MQKKHLLLFRSSNYLYPNVVYNEAKTLNIFDEIYSLTEKDLDENIYNVIQERIKKYGGRLYGYSTWRPYLILKYLNQIEDNDILLYIDSDFISLNENIDYKIKLFNKLFDRCNEFELLGQYGEGSNDLLFTTTKLRKCIEKYLDYQFPFNVLDEPQYASGFICMKKTPKVMQIVSLWNDILQNNFELVTDFHNNDEDNYEGFIENRHEQSIWSLLCKYYNVAHTDVDIYKEFFNWDYNFKKYEEQV